MSAEQDLKYGSIVYKEVEISHNEYLEQKYQSVSSKSGKHFAKICYHGSTIHPGKTYTDSYCKKNGLGKYASGTSSSSSSSRKSSVGSGLLGAAAGGIGGLVAKGIESERARSEEKKAQYKAERAAIDAEVQPYISGLKAQYPVKQASLSELLLWLPELLVTAESFAEDEKAYRYDNVPRRIANECKEATGKQAIKVGKRIKKLSKEQYETPEIKEMMKKADILSGRRGRRRVLIFAVIFYALLLLMLMVLNS